MQNPGRFTWLQNQKERCGVLRSAKRRATKASWPGFYMMYEPP